MIPYLSRMFLACFPLLLVWRERYQNRVWIGTQPPNEERKLKSGMKLLSYILGMQKLTLSKRTLRMLIKCVSSTYTGLSSYTVLIADCFFRNPWETSSKLTHFQCITFTLMKLRLNLNNHDLACRLWCDVVDLDSNWIWPHETARMPKAASAFCNERLK